jgi:hypothetical protein
LVDVNANLILRLSKRSADINHRSTSGGDDRAVEVVRPNDWLQGLRHYTPKVCSGKKETMAAEEPRPANEDRPVIVAIDDELVTFGTS